MNSEVNTTIENKSKSKYENRVEKVMISLSLITLFILIILLKFTSLNFNIFPEGEDAFFIFQICLDITAIEIIFLGKGKNKKKNRISSMLQKLLEDLKLIELSKGYTKDKYMLAILISIYSAVISFTKPDGEVIGGKLHHLAFVSIFILLMSLCNYSFPKKLKKSK